ncbi:MAG TPA: transporter substrate-binding domain-containing protein [Rhizobiaceae bacterium]|jgi:polar amino acid transport system substrate-binding protein|nr:transporter substrate-binding domain-containing protein [Rhizobiaceae bacterium]
MERTVLLFAAMAAALAVGQSAAHADKLDDIISSGKLRCAVTLDFPPMGFRDQNNTPIGFDVDTCDDLAKALGVTPQVVDTPFPDRIPAIVSGRADVAVASTSDTLERAKTVGFSIPYFAFQTIVISHKGSGISSYESLKGHKVGAVAGTYEALALEKDVKGWGDPKGSFRSYQTQNDVWLALNEGLIEGTVLANAGAVAAVKSGKFPQLELGGNCPYPIDFVGIATLREEYGLLNYLNLFVHQQTRSGRAQALYDKWLGGKMPDLTVPGVYR